MAPTWVWRWKTQLDEHRPRPATYGGPLVWSRCSKWLFGLPEQSQISTAHVWLVLLLAFAVADLLVIASSLDGLRLLQLGT